MTLRGGGGGGPALSVTMTLIFPKIVWTCPLIARDIDISNVELVLKAPCLGSLDLMPSNSLMEN